MKLRIVRFSDFTYDHNSILTKKINPRDTTIWFEVLQLTILGVFLTFRALINIVN